MGWQDNIQNLPAILRQPQGVLCDAIPILPAQIEHPFGYAVAASNLAGWAFYDEYLIPGEFPRQALGVRAASRYMQDVRDGGHLRFAEETLLNPHMMRAAYEGLQLAGAHDQLSIFRAFANAVGDIDPIALLQNDGARYDSVWAEAEDLDDLFQALPHAASDVLTEISAVLKAELKFTPVATEGDIKAEQQIIASRNQFREARLAEIHRIAAFNKQQRLRASPAGQLALKFCEERGIELLSMHATIPLIEILVTSAGQYWMDVEDGVVRIKDAEFVMPDHILERRDDENVLW